MSERVSFAIPARPAPCARCGRFDVPRVQLYGAQASKKPVLCVLCLADGIQLVTGWKMDRMVRLWAKTSPVLLPGQVELEKGRKARP